MGQVLEQGGYCYCVLVCHISTYFYLQLKIIKAYRKTGEAQPAYNCAKSTMETPKELVKSAQNKQ